CHDQRPALSREVILAMRSGDVKRPPRLNRATELTVTIVPMDRYTALKRRLSIWSDLIFDSSVDAGTPRRMAAPNGPATRPLLSLSAASIAARRWVASVPVERLATGGVPRHRPESHRASIERVSESHRITARSMTFCNSRMFPGQSYDWSSAEVSLVTLRIRL